MPHNPETKNELRCFCRRKPLLAMYGIDKSGKVYIHIKAFKQDRIFVEIVVTKGDVQVHCRECMRWHNIRILGGNEAVLSESAPPELASEIP